MTVYHHQHDQQLQLLDTPGSAAARPSSIDHTRRATPDPPARPRHSPSS